MSFARFLSGVVTLDASGDPYTFGFEFGSLANDEGDIIYDCECCPERHRAFYRAADDTFWCVMCWRVRQSFGNGRAG